MDLIIIFPLRNKGSKSTNGRGEKRERLHSYGTKEKEFPKTFRIREESGNQVTHYNLNETHE